MSNLIQKISGIYKITCKNNNKFYIGSSINISRRLKSHINSLKHNKHDNKYLQKDWNKYGEQNFKYEIIETIHNVDDLLIKEKWWIDNTKCCNRKIGFNISSTPHSMGLGRFIDLTGQKFGRLTCTKPVGKNEGGNYLWKCMCDCGNETIVTSGHLVSDRIKSCGCLHNEGNNFKHGHAGKGKKSRAYTIWGRIILKCNNPNNKTYKNYRKHNKPIKVCKRWSNKKNGFENFYKDIGDPPNGKSLDRINNEIEYGPSNWVWATIKEQQRNRINKIVVIFNRKNCLLIELAEKYNISSSVLWDRIYRYGWPIEKALTTPVRKHKKYKKRK